MSLGSFFSKRDSPILYEKKSILLWVECTRHKPSPRKASPSFYLKIFPFSPWAWICTRKSHREFVHDTVSNCVIEGKFYLREMNKHIYRKTVSQKVYFPFLSEDISFFTIAVHIPQMPPGSFLYKWDSPILSEKKSKTLCVECTRDKASTWKSSLQFLSEDIFFFTLSLKALPSIP